MVTSWEPALAPPAGVAGPSTDPIANRRSASESVSASVRTIRDEARGTAMPGRPPGPAPDGPRRLREDRVGKKRTVQDRTVERLLAELDSFLRAGLIRSALDHLRRVLSMDQKNPRVLELARAIDSQAQPEDLQPDEEVWLDHLLSRPRAKATPLPPPPASATFDDMVRLPGGTMTSAYGGEISAGPFLIDRTPVTNLQYAKFLRATGEVAPVDWFRDRPPPNKDEHPVVGITLVQARRYARWRGKRLPSASEWELAARSPDGRPFPWGAEWDPKRCNCKERGHGDTVPVTHHQDKDGPGGCQDLVGNVWEWTEILPGNSPPDSGYLWVFGGSYLHPCNAGDGIARTSVHGDKAYAYLGFRCAADGTEQA